MLSHTAPNFYDAEYLFLLAFEEAKAGATSDGKLRCDAGAVEHALIVDTNAHRF